MTIRVEVGLWMIALALGTTAFVMTARSYDVATVVDTPLIARATVPRDVRAAMRHAAEAIAGDPFRLDREPASIAFDPTRPATQSAAPAAPPKPTLAVRAVVGGPPWEALVDGIPGRSGSSRVRAGDRIAELIFVTINKDLVIVQGMDTTWRLGVARSWQ